MPVFAIATCRVDFIEMMEILDKRLNDKGKLWRHVYKVRPVSSRAARSSSCSFRYTLPSPSAAFPSLLRHIRLSPMSNHIPYTPISLFTFIIPTYYVMY